MTSHNRSRQSRSGIRLPLWGLGLLVVVVLLFLVVSSVWLFRFVLGLADDLEALSPDFGEVAQVDNPDEESGEIAVDPDTDEPRSIISNPLPQKWSGRERVNILLLGSFFEPHAFQPGTVSPSKVENGLTRGVAIARVSQLASIW